MIEAFSLKSAHHYGDALSSQARLRYRVFVERRSLHHDYFDGMEYDEFDTPAAVYLTWRDPRREVRGLIRLLPTTRKYMLQSYWPYLVDSGELPSSGDTWEITRVCVDKDVAISARQRILPELLCGVHEFFAANGIRTMIGVTRRHLVDHYLRQGVTWLGPVAEVEGELEGAFSVPQQHIRPEFHCRKLNIRSSVLYPFEDTGTRVAA